MWALRLLQVHVALVYAFSLPDKLTLDTAWIDGTAVYYAAMSEYWGRLPWHSWFYGPLLAPALTWGTLLVEAGVPLLVWFRRTRPWIVAAGVGMHLGIAVLVDNVGFFTLGMAAALLAFPTAAEYRALAARRPRRTARAVTA